MTSKEQLKHIVYMRMASDLSELSKATRLKVGALIMRDGRILSSGYNGTPSGFNNEAEVGNETLPIVVHAECNAILFCNSNFEEARMYCTLSPCPECVKLIKASGITKVFFKEKYRRYEETAKLANIFDLELKNKPFNFRSKKIELKYDDFKSF